MTPPTASGPYTAEAPPVTTSTRSIMAEGIVFTSMTSRPFEGIRRRPSASTRFRFGPRPRRLRVEMPMLFRAVGCTSPELATPVMFWAGENWGSLFRLASIATFEVFSKVWALTVTIGLLEE